MRNSVRQSFHLFSRSQILFSSALGLFFLCPANLEGTLEVPTRFFLGLLAVCPTRIHAKRLPSRAFRAKRSRRDRVRRNCDTARPDLRCPPVRESYGDNPVRLQH